MKLRVHEPKVSDFCGTAPYREMHQYFFFFLQGLSLGKQYSALAMFLRLIILFLHKICDSVNLGVTITKLELNQSYTKFCCGCIQF